MTRAPSVRRLLDKPVLTAGMIGILVFILIALIRATGFLQSAELAAYDLALRFRPAGDMKMRRIVILGINEADIRALGQWPLSDAVLADIIARVAVLGPRAIGVDIYRDTPIAPGSDDLAELLSERKDVIVVEKFGMNTAVRVSPPPALENSDQFGFSDLPVDSDGVVRKGLLFLDDGGDVHFAFSLRLALKFLQAEGIAPMPGEPEPEFLRLGPTTIRPFEKRDGGYVDADAAGYQFLLDFQGGASPFTRFSLAELHSGHVMPRDVKDRVVIIGVVADSVKDYFLTPFRQAAGLTTGMPGVVLHAHSVNQLLGFALDGVRQLRVFSEWQKTAWILLWSFGGAAVGFVLRSLLRFSLALVVGAGALAAIAYGGFLAGWWVPFVPVLVGWLGSGTLVTAYMSGHEKEQRRLVMELFSCHVSPDVAQEIWKQRDKFIAGGRLETKKLTATVLFSDLEDFTPVSEALEPETLMDWLNHYMDSMADIVMEQGGIVDDYYGDAIKANFGVPMARESDGAISQDAVNAVRCALMMRREMETLNERWREQGLPTIRMRIGICTGSLVAGCLGSLQRMKYTTIGDTVNTAARLEAYAKETGGGNGEDPFCRILITESTARRLAEQFEIEPVDSLYLKGKSNPVSVFRVVRDSVETTGSKRGIL